MKSLDALERLYIAGRLDLPYVMDGQQQKDYGTIEKYLKALEIIRNKTISACNCLMILKSRFDNLSYEDYTELFITELTQEEYELVKEVLL